MLNVTVMNNHIQFGKHFNLSFKRTVRVPDDGHTYQLPANLGKFPVFKVADYINTVPFNWIQHGGGVFIPMYQHEALWIDFNSPDWHPHAVRIGTGGVNVVNGMPFTEKMAQKDDYIVCPPQLWVDGFNIGEGIIRQFVAVPLGSGLTAEAIVLGEEHKGGIQLVVFPPKPGLFPESHPPYLNYPNILFKRNGIVQPVEMGLGGGGKISQKIYPDKYGFDTWDPDVPAKIEVHIVNSLTFKLITGLRPPESPINIHLYKKFRMPWFKIYDDEQDFINSSDFFTKP